MAVLSVMTRDLPMLRGVALKFGVPLDIVDVEADGTAYADLLGDPYRTLTVAVRAGGTPVAYVDKIEHGEVVKNYPARPSA